MEKKRNTRWTEIFKGASYSVGKGQVTISTYRNGGHVTALTRLNTPSTFYWTGESEKFRYYTLRKSSNGIYPAYLVSLNKQGWMVISRLRFGIVGESIKVYPYTIFTDFTDGNDVDRIVAGLKKKGLDLSSEGELNNEDALRNLAENILFLRQVLAGKADIRQWQSRPRDNDQTATTEKPITKSTKKTDDNGDGKADTKTVKRVKKVREKKPVTA